MLRGSESEHVYDLDPSKCPSGYHSAVQGRLRVSSGFSHSHTRCQGYRATLNRRQASRYITWLARHGSVRSVARSPWQRKARCGKERLEGETGAWGAPALGSAGLSISQASIWYPTVVKFDISQGKLFLGKFPKKNCAYLRSLIIHIE